MEAAAAAGFGQDMDAFCRHVLVRSLYDLGAVNSAVGASMLGISRMEFLARYKLSAASLSAQVNEELETLADKLDEPDAPRP